MAAEGEATEHEEPQRQEFGGTEGWDDPGGEPGDLSSLSAQTEWLNQQPMVRVAALFCVCGLCSPVAAQRKRACAAWVPASVADHPARQCSSSRTILAVGVYCRTLARHAPAARFRAVRFSFLHTL